MKLIVGPDEMKSLDQKTIQKAGLSSETLMERAALCVVHEIRKHIPEARRFFILCGSGNNGGDGIAIARLLHLAGYETAYLMAGSNHHMTESTRKQKATADYYDVPYLSVHDTNSISHWMKHSDAIVDALFGVGLSREISGIYTSLIYEANRQNAYRISVDLPSGIDGETGQILGSAFCADLTVTFAYRKKGLCLDPGRRFAGKIVTGDIGIYGSAGNSRAIEDKDFSMLPVRSPEGNKGTFGKVLVLAGSPGMCGAAYFCAKAVLQMGAGMVQIHTVPENLIPLQTLLPEALYSTGNTLEECRRLYDWADVMVLGPGLGMSEERGDLLAWYLREAVRDRKITVLDADGINLFHLHPKWAAFTGPHLVFTPHIGEMQRLTGKSIREIKQNPVKAARDAAQKYGCTFVLKDASTVVCAPNDPVYFNLSGCDALATAGSGDVLSGILGGILCSLTKSAKNPFSRPSCIVDDTKVDEAFIFFTAFGVYLHGRCGEDAAGRIGRHSVKASDILDSVPNVLKSLNEPSMRGKNDE